MVVLPGKLGKRVGWARKAMDRAVLSSQFPLQAAGDFWEPM